MHAQYLQVLSQESQKQGLSIWRPLEAVLTLNLGRSLIPGAAIAQSHGVRCSQGSPGASSLSVLCYTAFITGINTGLSQNLLEREHLSHWFFLRV